MTSDLDLFGEPVVLLAPHNRVIHRYGKGWKGGYAAAPGSGPKDQTCGTCKHYASVGGNSRRYPKCLLMRHHWTKGPGSDIKKRMVACSRWEAKDSFPREANVDAPPTSPYHQHPSS